MVKVIIIIKLICTNFEYSVMDNGDLTKSFKIGSGIKQRCERFLLVIGWVLRQTSISKKMVSDIA